LLAAVDEAEALGTTGTIKGLTHDNVAGARVVKIHSKSSFAAQIDRESEKHLPITQVLRRTNS
jgi:hypothetical protein